MEKIAEIACKSRNIANDNEVFLKKTPMTMTLKQSKVDFIADRAVEMLGAPQSRTFFCKCAQYLSEDEIYSAIEIAKRPNVRMPAHYVSRVLKTKLLKRGVAN